MKQIIVSKTNKDYTLITVDYHKKIDFFIDSFEGFIHDDSFKILHVLDTEATSKFRDSVIKNHKLFDAIITYDKEILSNCKNSYFMPFGTSWISDYEFIEKKFQISHLTGFKLMADGHFLRHKIHYKQNKIINPKDFYLSRDKGSVENFASNKILGDKKDPLFESQFHICIENSKQEYCFTEKLIDCFVTKTIPIYWGCPGIEKFFDINGMFIVNDANEIIEVCNNLNENSYNEKLFFVEKNYELSKKYITIVDRLQTVIEKILKNEPCISVDSYCKDELIKSNL